MPQLALNNGGYELCQFCGNEMVTGDWVHQFEKNFGLYYAGMDAKHTGADGVTCAEKLPPSQRLVRK